MRIELKKFGTTLTSRQLGKEAFSAYAPVLKELAENEIVEIDFSGVNTFSPSWGDEFLTQLHYKYGKKLKMLNTQNPSVKATLSILETTNGIKFIVKN